jgi:predicted ATP-dependent endonuclease of OLD family
VFTFLSNKENVVLLIDEIEQHLHYDAQADLIQHLQNDTSIEKVIYTTHSAGALPEDLGSGIRLIKWDEKNPQRSVAVNKFWGNSDGSAFRPLLFGMGATTFAFFPARKALVAEGPTELILLPKLMKEALKSGSLGFQIVHGLSNLDPSHLKSVGADTSAVAYFADNDPGGRSLTKRLKKAGVADDRIFHIGNVGPFDTIEDLIEPKIWKQAVNTYIEMYGKSRGVTKPITSAPPRGRIANLPKAIRKEKVGFAYNILDFIDKNPDLQILTSRAKMGLVKTTSAIRETLLVQNSELSSG